MRREQIAVVAALVVIVALRIAAPPIREIPAIGIEQGISVHTIEGHRVFIDRQGSTFNVFDAASAHEGARVKWCPYEELFYSSHSHDIFDRQGKHARGPSRGNMPKLKHTLTQSLQLAVDVRTKQVEPAAGGTVDKGILEFYERYENQGTIPGTRPLIFCPNALE